MQYRKTPKEKHTKRMTMETPNFADVILPTNPPHDNDSRETLGELKFLQTLESDKDYVKKHDDVKKVFIELLKEFEVHTSQRQKVIETLVDQSRKFIMAAKYKYNRPRPYQVAEFYDMDLNGKELDSMKTPSYPSGHAVQGYLMGMIYSERHPEYREVFTQLGEDIAHSRINAKAHFPSDKKFGKEIAERLFDNLI